MAEAPQPATPQAPATPAAPAAQPQSHLEKVYSDFNVEAEAESFQPQTPQAPAKPATPTRKVPDVFDPNFGTHQEALVGNVAALNDAVSQAMSRVSNMEQGLMKRQTEADIRDAARTIADSAGVDHEVAEVQMEVKARNDPRFRAIWNNRQKNPKAFEAATKALAAEVKDKFTVRQDPQLAENQRAVRTSQQQMATTTKETDQDKWGSMTPQQRADERARIRRFG